ncbi:MAG: AbrB/MazE/SpoVT family DNA-binding domain-containing protein [Thermoplasmatota archaeon]
MDKVKVSSKFQIVIPLSIREHLGISPGEELIMVEKGGVVHMIRVGDIRSMKGTYKELATEGIRDEEDRY